jgi:hypothetical protein
LRRENYMLIKLTIYIGNTTHINLIFVILSNKRNNKYKHNRYYSVCSKLINYTSRSIYSLNILPVRFICMKHLIQIKIIKTNCLQYTNYTENKLLVFRL